MTSDFLIIGAGSAGNVLARRLIDAGRTVTLLEAGADESANPDIAHLTDLGKIWHSEQDWNYWTGPQEGCHDRRLHLPRGKVVGGSHALNACIFVRGHRQDYADWQEHGCAGWDWEDVLPWFKKIEAFDGGASETRGGEGLLDVREDFEHNLVQDSMLEAAQQAGFPANPDYNSGETEGVARMQLNVRDGMRFNTWHAYLQPVADREELVLVRNARVLRLLLEEDRAVGAVYEQDGQEHEVRAGTVVLCAGALGSPEILLRSGIGPAAELAEAGVEVRTDLPGVGKNLHDHLLVPVVFETTARQVPESPVAPAEVHLFARSSPEQPVPDTQPIFFSIPMYSEGYGPGNMDQPMDGPEAGFTLMAGLVRPESRGELRLTGAGQDDPVAVDIAALEEQADVDALVASVRHCQEIGRQPALAEEWGAREVWPGTRVPEGGLEDYVRDSVVTYHHQVGTCAMGTGPEDVVDPRTFGVHGVRGLHVADASIMPRVTSGNTNAPTIMIAERAAEVLAQG